MMKLSVDGRITEPVSFKANNGKVGRNFSIAHEYKEKKGEDTIVLVQWIDCTQWANGDKPLIALAKGDLVKVMGIPVTEVYQAKESKEFKAKMKCIVSYIEVVNELPFE